MAQPYLGQLNTNVINNALYNMIISQSVKADNIDGGYHTLVDENKVDGTLFGDTKLYYSTDAIESLPYLPDSSDQLNVLAVKRNKKVKIQSLTIDQFRQIFTTVDEYLSKQAWSSESVFSEYKGILLKWIRDTKRIFEETNYNAFFGTEESAAGKQTQTVNFSSIIDADTTVDQEATNRLEAETIGEKIAEILADVKDINRDYNDYGYLRATTGLKVVWNGKWARKIKKFDLPSLYHNDGIVDMFGEGTILPARYFGERNTTAGTAASTNTTVRAMHETYYDKDGDFNYANSDEVDIHQCGLDSIPATAVHVFAGDLIPGGCKYRANETYTEDGDVICKIYEAGAIPLMSAFEVATEWTNSRNLSSNHYLTFGFNTLERLKDKPFVTLKVAE